MVFGFLAILLAMGGVQVGGFQLFTKFLDYPDTFTTEESSFFAGVCAVYATTYYITESAQLLKVEALNGMYNALKYTKLVMLVYLLVIVVFIDNKDGSSLTLGQLLIIIAVPQAALLIIMIFVFFKIGRFAYPNLLYVQMKLFRPFRPKILGEVVAGILANLF